MGCCCGHPDRGGPKTVPGTLKRQMRRAFREARLEGLRLAFTDCLGPCSEANVIFVYAHGRPFWLRRINTVETFDAVLAWAGEVAAGGPAPLPPALAFWLALLWLWPNTQQIMREQSPALDYMQSAKEPMTPWLRDLVARLVWRPTPAWAMAAGALFALGLLNLTQISEFLYYRF